MNSLNKTARAAGILYLILVVVGPFSLMYVPSSLIVPGDAAATADNIMANESLFRFGMVGESIIFLTEIVLPIFLYVLLKPVNQTLSLVAASARLAMAAIQGINLLNRFAALLLLSGAGYLTAFEPDQLNALVMLFLDVHTHVEIIWGLFFGLHLLVLGYLVFKAGYIPRILGILLMLASLGYLTDNYGKLLLPNYTEIPVFLAIPIAIAEMAFPLWLLIKGVKEPPLDDHAPASA